MSKKNGKAKYEGQSINVAMDSTGSGTTPQAPTRTSRRKSRSELKERTLHTDPTRDYQSTRYQFYGELYVNNLPLWRLWTARMMLASDPIVNFSLNVRNAALMAGEVEVTGKSQKIVDWVKEQWDKLWYHHRTKLVSAKKWGFAPLQAVWKENNQGQLVIKTLKDFAPEDCRALEISGNRLVGMRVRGQEVYLPQALWLTHSPEFGSHYGHAVTRRQYPAWYEKWMDHGAKRLLQLRMVKDAYIGDIFWYPPNMMVELPDGTKFSWRDMMREIGENRLSGGALTLPRLLDNNGKELTGYSPPQEIGGATTIFQWVEDCDDSILKGADVPSEVIAAANTGSGFSGRSIPFLVLLSVCNNEFVDIVNQLDEQLLRPAAWLNFGGEPEYEIKAKNLVESFSSDISGSSLAGGSIGGQPGQVPLQAPPGPPQQFEELHPKAPPGGITIHGQFFKGGQYIPKELLGTLTEEEKSNLNYGSKEPEMLDGYEVIKPLGGSTGATLVKGKNGKNYVVKKGATEGHAENEYKANKLYQALGVKVPESHYIDGKLFTEYVEGTPLNQLSGEKREQAEELLRKNFVVDALLGNWDVIGLAADNIIVDKNGIPWRVDNGGALEYRAKGAKKGDKWNDKLEELDSMRKMGEAGKVFGKLTDKDIALQAQTVLNKAVGLVMSGEITGTLHQRLQTLEKKIAPHSEEAQISGETKQSKTEGGYDYSSVKGGYTSLKQSLGTGAKDFTEVQLRKIAIVNTANPNPTTLIVPKNTNDKQLGLLKTAYPDKKIVPAYFQTTLDKYKNKYNLADIKELWTMPLTAFEKETANELASKGVISKEQNKKIQAMPEINKKIEQPSDFGKGFNDPIFFRAEIKDGKLTDTNTQQGNRDQILEAQKAWEKEYISQSTKAPFIAWKGASKPFRVLEAEGKLDDPKLKEFHEWLDKAPKYRGITYRGLNHVSPGTAAYAAITTVGGVVHFQSSACSSRNTTTPFNFGGSQMLLRVATKSGVDIKNLHSHAGEDEVILRKGTKYRVVGVHHGVKVGGKTTQVFVDLEELHPEDEYTFAYSEQFLNMIFSEERERENRFVETEPDKFLQFYLPEEDEDSWNDDEEEDTGGEDEEEEEEEEDETEENSQYNESHPPAHLHKIEGLKGEEGYHYHATNEDNLREIAQSGLGTFHPWHGTDQSHWPDGTRERRSYWHHDPNVTKSFAPAEGKPVLIRARTSNKKGNKRFFRESGTGDSYARKRIRPKNLEYLGHTGQWHPVTALTSSQHSEEQSYSCLMFNLPGELAFEVRMLGDLIPIQDLVEKGKELNPHITVKYGLHADDPEEVRKAIQEAAPIAIQLGKTSSFSNDKYDVVKIEVESKGLHDLNKKVCDTLPHTDTYPDYKPHVTIAYVKKGLGEHYAKRLNLLEGKVAVFDRLIFSNRQREWTPITLTGSSQFMEGEYSLPFDFPTIYNNSLKRDT